MMSLRSTLSALVSQKRSFMKIILQIENKTVTIESDGVDIDHAIEMMKDALLAIGFHPDLVNSHLGDLADDYN